MQLAPQDRYRLPAIVSQVAEHFGISGRRDLKQYEQADILTRDAPAPAGVLIANPPYGERIGSEEDLARFYPALGNALKARFAGWRCFFFTADTRLPKLIRLQPAKRTPLYNGALECRLYEFEIVSGSHRGR